MRRPDAYAYALARVYAKRSYMLTKPQLEALAKSISYHQALRSLATTSYAKYVEDAEGLIEVERGLVKSYNDLFNELVGLVRGAAREFIEACRRKHELEVLKALLRAKLAGLGREEALRNIVPVGSFTHEVCERFLSARDATAAAMMIDDPLLRGSVLDAVRKAMEESTPLPVELAVDSHAYAMLGKAVEGLKGMDRDWARRLIGEEVDVKNFVACLRLRSLGLRDYVRYLLPYKLRFTAQLAEKVVQAPTMGEAVAAVSHLWELPAKASTVSEVEDLLQRRLLHVNEAAFLHYGFHVGLLQALLNLKYFEVRNLKVILIGKSEELPSDEIIARLVL